MSVYIYVCVCNVCRYTCMSACVGQSSMLAVLVAFYFIFLRQGLSLVLELTDLAELSKPHATENLLYPPPPSPPLLELQVQIAVPCSFRWVLRLKQTLMLMQ